MDWLFGLSAACILVAVLMLPVFRLFIPTPSRSRAVYRRAKAARRLDVHDERRAHASRLI